MILGGVDGGIVLKEKEAMVSPGRGRSPPSSSKTLESCLLDIGESFSKENGGEGEERVGVSSRGETKKDANNIF